MLVSVPIPSSDVRADLWAQADRYGFQAYRCAGTPGGTWMPKQGPGVLIALESEASGTTSTVVTIYDNTSATGRIIMQVKQGLQLFGWQPLGIAFDLGLTVTVTGAQTKPVLVVFI